MSQTLNNLKKLIIEIVEEEVSTNEYASTQAKKRKKRGLAPLESVEEKLNLFLEKNTPTNPSKWSYYKSQAKKKFDVYPSAYANAWAAKKYKAAGGGWKKEQIGEASMTGNLDGGEGPPKTPYAFQSKKKRKQDKDKEDSIATTSTGFKKVNEAVDEGDFIKAIQEIQAGLDEAEYGFNDLGRLKGMSSSDKRIVKTLSSKFKVLMKDVEKARRVITTESINEATKQEVNALKKFIKDFDKMQKQYWNISKIGDKELTNPKYNKHYETILAAQKSIVQLAREIQEKERIGEGLNEGRYHQWRNDESLTPKQKIGRSIREVRDSLKELNKTINMNLKLKTELQVDSRDYWKTTHKALSGISEKLVKLAGKVGSLK